MRYPYTSDSHLDQLIKSTDHFIVTTDLEGNITFCNEAFQKRYQIVGESVLGVGFDAFIDIEDMVRFKLAVTECVRKQLPSVKISYKVLSGSDHTLRQAKPSHWRVAGRKRCFRCR